MSERPLLLLSAGVEGMKGQRADDSHTQYAEREKPAQKPHPYNPTSMASQNRRDHRDQDQSRGWQSEGADCKGAHGNFGVMESSAIIVVGLHVYIHLSKFTELCSGNW